MVCSIFAIFGLILFMGFFVFPFLNSLSPEKRLEKYIDKKCLEGNQVAIHIRRKNMFYMYPNIRLIRAAIDGNEHAIKALKLDLGDDKTFI